MLWERVVGFRVRHNMPLASANDLHQALARVFHLAGFSAPLRHTRVSALVYAFERQHHVDFI